MAKPVFLSFCYDDDVTRVQQIIKMGVVEGQQILNPNDFEKIKRNGESEIKKWIDEQLMYKQCLIVLIGENTANRHYVKYEMQKAREKKMPMLGIYIHNIRNLNGKYSKKGKDPFVEVFGANNSYKCKDPLHIDSDGLRAYNTIAANINNWIEEAIKENKIRNNPFSLV